MPPSVWPKAVPLLVLAGLCAYANCYPKTLVFNVLIHLAATVALYGVVRRALLSRRFGDRFADRAPSLAFAVALLWTLHPIQVQCVTYVIQRGESMAGLFYLFILYC